MIEPIKDTNSGLWKWGRYGKPQYKTAEECRAKELDVLAQRLNHVKEQIRSGAIRI